jgi:hypothetical protein
MNRTDNGFDGNAVMALMAAYIVVALLTGWYFPVF